MNRKAILTIIGSLFVALISGYVLWYVFTDVSKVEEMGLIGILLVSLMSHSTMIAKDLFIPLIIALTPFYNPFLLGASAGIGGAAGDLVPYLIGLGISETVTNQNKKIEDLVSKWVNKFGLWVILFMAMTPLPDLPIMMLAGTRRLSFKKIFLIEAFGKTVLYSFGAYFGGWIFNILIDSFGSINANIIIVIGSIVFSLFLTWPPTRDWFFSFLNKFIPS